MKELSIEEKAKAYDEVLKKARMFYKDEHVDNEVNSLLEVLFPELKESEDERIRKRIISALVEWEDKCSFPGDSGDMIAWLEKQGEQKPQGKSALEAINEEKVDNANKVEPRQEELTEFERAVKQVMEEAIECGDTHNLKADADMLLSLVHNSAWSEEDEDIQNEAIYFIRREPYRECDAEPIVDWLKSLKDRVQHQPTWKPSDEQLDALNDVISSRDIKYDVLSELWNDLNKLKG